MLLASMAAVGKDDCDCSISLSFSCSDDVANRQKLHLLELPLLHPQYIAFGYFFAIGDACFNCAKQYAPLDFKQRQCRRSGVFGAVAISVAAFSFRW